MTEFLISPSAITPIWELLFSNLLYVTYSFCIIHICFILYLQQKWRWRVTVLTAYWAYYDSFNYISPDLTAILCVESQCDSSFLLLSWVEHLWSGAWGHIASVFLLILRAEVGTVFALSWLITWFGHVLSDFRHVVRLYDFFLACHPLMPIYFAAVVSKI